MQSKARKQLIISIKFVTKLNPSLCSQILPHSSSRDLKALGQIAIDITQTNVKQTSNLIVSLSGLTTNRELKKILSTCAKNYEDASRNLDVARQSMTSSNIFSVHAGALNAESDLNNCDDEFEGTPNLKPSQLQQASKKVEDLCGIILVISASFGG
ncbi:Pectinesterase inhibitor [Camellia lanceoleosa]|uniref:Pectinesterase inhibitor n=1 Tax=Camellia lanceoleosa TaxID=1840588 RepID=A0ACC0GTS8_9ERIC|nr:Pectinesterase inhibitor [Camellia lanceoleosa]